MDKGEPLKPGVLEDRFARLGVMNSRSLLRAADALASTHEYGHGLALVSLAMEELETAHAYRLVADGIATFNPKEARFLQYIDREALLQHKPKSNMLAERMLMLFNIEKVTQVFRRIRGREPTPEEIGRVMAQKDPVVSPEAKRTIDFPTVVKEGRAIKEDLRRLNGLKNRGLYVIEKGGRLTTPSDATEQEFRHYRTIADKLVALLQEATENGFSPYVAEGMRQSYAEYRRVHKRLEGPLNPKRIGDEDTSHSDYDYDPLAEGGDAAGDSPP